MTGTNRFVIALPAWGTNGVWIRSVFATEPGSVFDSYTITADRGDALVITEIDEADLVAEQFFGSVTPIGSTDT